MTVVCWKKNTDLPRANLIIGGVSSSHCLGAGLGSITFLSGTLLITFNVMHDTSMNIQVRCVISLYSLPFMTFWCKIMTKNKFEL
jgi:hypothetical protein